MSDNLYVNRNNTTYQVDMENLRSIEDTDLLLVNRNGVTYTVTGDKIGGGAINNLNPAIPPFISQSGPETIVTNSDGKVEFSLDETNWLSSITIPAETIYYCDWTDDILSAAHDSKYETSINVIYPNVGATQDIELSMKIDKMPDPFTLDTNIGVNGLTTYTSNTISPLDTINAPTAVWGSSNADSAQIAIADGAWEALPTAINTRYVNRNERVRVRHTTGALPAFEYETTLNIGYGGVGGEYETSTFSTETLDVVFDVPTITPGSNTNIDKDIQVFTLSSPTGSNINHTATDWQFASDAAFTNILVESLNDSSNLLSYTLSGTTDGQILYARGRFIDASGTTSSYAVSDNLTARAFYFWRFQVRINGGGGGGGKYDGQTSNSGGGGGQGYVVFESLAASPTAPGSIQRNDGGGGSSGSGTTGGSGAFGTNGGNGTYCGGNDAHRSGGGGGGGGVKLNGALLAGVGGGGGQAARHSNNANQNAGGSGANLPSSNGSTGITPQPGYGNNGGTSSSNPGGSNGGDSNGCRDDGKWSSGGGGGGFGPGWRGTSYSDARGQGGGGGASWNQSIGYTNGGYQLTHAQSGSVTGTTRTLAKYRAPSTDPGNWQLVKEDNVSNTIDLGSF